MTLTYATELLNKLAEEYEGMIGDYKGYTTDTSQMTTYSTKPYLNLNPDSLEAQARGFEEYDRLEWIWGMEGGTPTVYGNEAIHRVVLHEWAHVLCHAAGYNPEESPHLITEWGFDYHDYFFVSQLQELIEEWPYG